MRATLLLIGLVTTCSVFFINSNGQAQKVDSNVQTMEQAARTLRFSLPENAAYMLERLTAFGDTEVAVIFGYVDNRAACRDISNALINGRVGDFSCRKIR